MQRFAIRRLCAAPMLATVGEPTKDDLYAPCTHYPRRTFRDAEQYGQTSKARHGAGVQRRKTRQRPSEGEGHRSD